MTLAAETIDLSRLPSLSAVEVQRRNIDLMVLGRAVFRLEGQAITFSLAESKVNQTWVPAVWLALRWNGQPCLAGISASWAEAMTHKLIGQSLQQLGEGGLELLGRTRLADLLLEGLAVTSVSTATVPDVPQTMSELGTWRGYDASSREPSGHVIQLWGEQDFALQSLLIAIARSAAYRERSPLASTPIALPLIAAKWQVPASILTDLEVGDVLILS